MENLTAAADRSTSLALATVSILGQAPSRVGYVIDRNQSGVWVKFDKDCASCRSCGMHSSGWQSSGKQSLGRLPAEIIHLSRSVVGSSEINLYHLKRQLIGNRIELSMTLGSQCWLLLNSLILPLMGFILAALISNQLGVGELISVLSSIIGMAIGIVFCQKFAIQRLKITEI